MSCDSCPAHCDIVPLADQPPSAEFITPDGVFIKEMLLPVAELYVQQHAQEYAHTSLLACGSVRVWAGKDGTSEDFHAPAPIEIAAGVKHTFMSLEDNTVIYCIHNVSRTAGQVQVRDEHQFGSVD
jgi:hypothetical protein